MYWNLRLVAAERGIHKMADLQQRLAEHGNKFASGKMYGLWSGRPISVRLDDLAAFCDALDCGVEELFTREPATLPLPAADPGEPDVTSYTGRR
ncbi:helix-turn-helix transcriptional regulator [Saccharopolyspora indica]|uniref:helix-turn-helix domain-containing protein n=1 Tax=Saccharopolyspora indica TaxID=1229659 RepID=UPI0022EA2478|nr:helix-turn-helix transcriptional regulator [Saccharopolyspora indica]MDA3644342.1 helix-turn-helix transcriptional regulator [Saccharopolyspora indica]